MAFFAFLVFVIPMFVAGGLLSKRTGLRGSQLYAGRYKKAVASFLWGCLLFVPLGLTNAAAGSPSFPMTWVNRWWIPLSQPWFSGIVEEAWWRLFTVSLCYFLLRPAFRKRPAIPLVCAMLFSAIIFGLGHAGTFQERLLMTGLLYGLPLSVTFARRDWEHAVGAHYMINMIPTLMVFLET
ncbi:MAG: CPBP family intramembrane metalloprotease [Anaerolineae bacterium]|nr:CPBP family intramembrane metalloprotease [Anaerolineae bacterium]